MGVEGSELRVSRRGLRVKSLGRGIEGSGFKVQDSQGMGFRVQCSVFRV